MSLSSQRVVYLNGEFLPLEDAKISVMDRGFLFGDGVYEVIPVFNGVLFRPHSHLQRLKQSLAAIQLELLLDFDQLIEIFEELLQRNAVSRSTHSIYVQITRGAAPTRDHVFPEGVPCTVFAQCSPMKTTSIEELSLGAKAITIEDIRWQWCYIKAISLLPNVLYAQRAKEAGAKEAILIRDGKACEGSSSNLFIVKKGMLITPPVSQQILRGVTRDLILEFAHEHSIPHRENEISESELKKADEVWMTGSIKEILPITLIDNETISDGKVGSVWHKVIRIYQAYKESFAKDG
jgi:D-alanine transaminase